MSKDDSQQGRQWLQVPLRGHSGAIEPRVDTDGKTAHPESVDNSRNEQAAAAVVRTQIEQVYNTNPPNQPKQEPSSDPNSIPSVYDRHHTDAPSYDWNEYHNAWQDYYQQYYGRYYLQQLHAERQKTLMERASNAASSARPVDDDNDNAPEAQPEEGIKAEILTQVKTRAKKFKSSNHFMPLTTALAVGFVFFMLQFNKVIAAQVNSYVSPSQTISDNVIVDPNASPIVGKESRLIIPKINVDVPIIYGLKSLDNDSTQKVLENGVAHYPIPGANSMPGQTGNNVILGHSSNDVLAPGDYKFAFVLLERLNEGDLFYIHYKETRYVYRITGKEVINPDQVSKLVKPNDTPLTTLVTCTPIGTDDRRLLVYSEQISPDPGSAEKVQPEEGENQRVKLPGNERSVLQRLFRF